MFETIVESVNLLGFSLFTDELLTEKERYKAISDELDATFAELATEICSITNQIFEELNIPDILKRGILTPVLKKKKDKTLPGN
jgi:hypothetical protein